MPALPAAGQATTPEVAAPEEVTGKDAVKAMIKGFEISGNTVFESSVLLALLQDCVGKEMGIIELRRAANLIADHYRKSGRLAKVYLPDQDLVDGIVRIEILESKFGKLIIERGDDDKLRLKDWVAQNFGTHGQEPGRALDVYAVQRSTNLLNDLPGVSASAFLQKGEAEGETDVVMKLRDTPVASGMLMFDNYGNRSTGVGKVTAFLALENAIGYGEQFSFIGSKTVGMNFGRLNVNFPVGSNGLRLGASYSALNYDVLNADSNTDPDGHGRTYGLEAKYPLIRANTGNLFLNANWEHRQFNDYSANIETSDRELKVFSLELAGNKVDNFGGAGVTSASIDYHSGNLDLSGNQSAWAYDQVTTNSDGHYSKAAWTLNRLQRLSENNSLWLSASGQFAWNNLDTSEKMVLGGPYGVRAYPVSEALGDEGYQVTAELRRQFMQQLQGIAFYDFGHIKVNNDTWPGDNGKNEYSLKGPGLGLVWTEAGNYSFRLTYARRIGENPIRNDGYNGKDSDGSKIEDRVWAAFVKYF